jgi:hypothetical protein
MPYATKGLCINVRKHCVELFDAKKGRRPQVKQSRGLLDMEEGGAYLAADVLGLPVIPETDARRVGSEIRCRYETCKAEVAAAKKEAGKKAARLKLDAAERQAMVAAAGRRVEQEKVELSLPSKRRCAAVAAAATKPPQPTQLQPPTAAPPPTARLSHADEIETCRRLTAICRLRRDGYRQKRVEVEHDISNLERQQESLYTYFEKVQAERARPTPPAHRALAPRGPREVRAEERL